jgi:protein-disulfide isomerase
MPKKNERKSQLKLQRRRSQTRRRVLWIAAISILAISFAAVLIGVSNRPVGEIRSGPQIDRPQVDRNSMGDPNAPVKVEEFSDFQCPYCRLFSEEEESNIVEKYIKTGKVYFTYTAFSFLDGNDANGESKSAAQAAYCAADQGQFWEYHDVLFANQNGENIGDFTDKRLLAFADSLGLDKASFQNCYNGGQYRQQVLDDLARGRSLGVTGTPTFIVNGTLIVGYANLQQTIEAELSK